MKVTFLGMTVTVSWRHRHGYSGLKFSHITDCIVMDGEKIVCSGHAFCSNSDQFVKSHGRKVAMTRAIAGFRRQERKLFWDAYHAEVS